MQAEIKKLLDSLSIKFVRIMPMVFMLVCGIYYIDAIISFNLGYFTEFYDEEGTFLYMMYETPIYDYIIKYFNYSYLTLILFYMLSYRMNYCAYHRVALHYLVINLFLVYYFSDKLTTETTMLLFISGLIILTGAIALVVYLYLKRKPSKR